MKISIITFHNTSNFGATLQCTALSRYLESIGNEVFIIDYLPQYILNKKSVLKEFKKIGSSRNKLKAFAKGFAYLSHYSELRRRDMAFETFINKNLRLTSTYHTIKELCDNPPKSDFFICGSDQIWNPALTGNSFDDAFFLTFTNRDKASYGASVGELNIEQYGNEIKAKVGDFKGVSVREISVAGRLSEVLNQDVKTVLDCTLLLKGKDYSALEKEMTLRDKPYLLFYDMQRSKASEKVARQIAEQKRLRIIDISPSPFITVKGSEKRIDIGPGEFLHLVKNASYIVTNSFHGTVFSILYHKTFLTFLHSTRSGRVVDLLNELDLHDRIVDSADIVPQKEINYLSVDEKLDHKRQQSYGYLRSILEAASHF